VALLTCILQKRYQYSFYLSVIIRVHQQKPDGTRTYDRKHACLFCGELKAKISRHLEKRHSDEVEVIRVLKLTDKAKRQKEFERMRLKGNFSFNIKVLQRGHGELIVARRPRMKRNAEEYIPCIHCFAFIYENEMWRHSKQCPFNDSKTPNPDDDDNDDLDDSLDECPAEKSEMNGHSAKVQSRMLLAGAARETEPMDYVNLKKIVISRMRNDLVKSVIEKDSLILKFGSIWLNRIGHKKHYVVAQRMRQLGRLLIAFRQRTGRSQIPISDAISGANFDSVVKATKDLCRVSTATTLAGVALMDNPSVGLQLGHTLKKCSLIKYGMGLRGNNNLMSSEAQTFLELFNGEWTELISSHALQSIKERRYNSVELIPVTADLLKLREFLSKELLTYEIELENSPSPSTWKCLSHVVFCLITLFNKRRGGEVSRMPLTCFTKRPNWKQNRNDDILKSLSPLELRLTEK